MILLILRCGKIMQGTGGTFQQSYVLGNVMNREVSDVLDTYILRIGLEQARYSFATAAGLFKSVINLSLLVSANWLSRKLTEKSLF
jgi:putative aldouronate transport system permease protein